MGVPPLDILAKSHRARLATTPGAESLGERTWSDLDLDSVFSKIDRTVSTLGRQALYHRLRVTTPPAELTAFDALVSRMSEDAAGCERAAAALGRLQDPHGYDPWWMGQPSSVENRPWYAVFPFLTGGAILSVFLIPISVAPVLAMLAVNLIVRLVSNQHIGQITRSFRQLAPIIGAAQSLRFLTGDDIHLLVQPIARDTARLRRLKFLSRWSNDNVLMLTHPANPLAVIVNDVLGVIYEYVNTLFLIDASGVYFGVNDLRVHGGALLRVVAAIGEVDAAIAIARYRESQPVWSRPVFTDDGQVSATDLCHPLLDAPTPNSVDFHLGEGVLITGSNMSGKSTFLRTVGVNAVLAQTINTCLAREYRAPRFRVCSSIGRADSLLAGKSYYVVEVEALVALIQSSESREPHLILLDELFHGTNAVERIAAADAVLRSLIRDEDRPKPHLVIAATHDLELISLLAKTYADYHFGGSIGADGPFFDHRLMAGASGTRMAIALLRQKGAPQHLLQTAEATARRLDDQRSNVTIKVI